ncbi:hypothetical protein [Rummeliibacillus stabekisii]|uniref:hypothetical protein n=1 Tax=Rummeliibacillus stabekisii TaxID=241244 RepID=UPI00371935D6
MKYDFKKLENLQVETVGNNKIFKDIDGNTVMIIEGKLDVDRLARGILGLKQKTKEEII